MTQGSPPFPLSLSLYFSLYFLALSIPLYRSLPLSFFHALHPPISLSYSLFLPLLLLLSLSLPLFLPFFLSIFYTLYLFILFSTFTSITGPAIAPPSIDRLSPPIPSSSSSSITIEIPAVPVPVSKGALKSWKKKHRKAKWNDRLEEQEKCELNDFI